MSNLDEVFEIVSQQLPAAGVDCLLIGGFAVNHYGYTRNTLDVDFMIVSERLGDVRRIMLAAGFSNIDVHENVAFFAIPTEGPRVSSCAWTILPWGNCSQLPQVRPSRGYAARFPSLANLLP